MQMHFGRNCRGIDELSLDSGRCFKYNKDGLIKQICWSKFFFVLLFVTSLKSTLGYTMNISVKKKITVNE